MPTSRYLALPALAGALLGASVAAFAQSGPPPAGPNAPYAATQSNGGAAPDTQGAARPHRHGGPMRRALKGLALSPEQRTKIHGFMHSYRAARASGTPESRARLIAQIEGVLTPDERAHFESRLHRQHPPANGASAPEPNAQ